MTQRSQKKPNYNARISALEKAVSELRQELRSISNDFGGYMRLSLPEAPKPKRGRKRDIQSFVLMDRDELIETLESYWPEMGPACNKLNPKLLRRILQLIENSPDREKANAAKHLLFHFDILITFLRSDRYREEPRNIANALAGVPKVSWWRSLKHCGSHPSEKMRHDRVIRDYLRRKHPNVYERLQRANGDVVRITVELRNVRSRDPLIGVLQRTAIYAAQIWQAGTVDYSALRKLENANCTE